MKLAHLADGSVASYLVHGGHLLEGGTDQGLADEAVQVLRAGAMTRATCARLWPPLGNLFVNVWEALATAARANGTPIAASLPEGFAAHAIARIDTSLTNAARDTLARCEAAKRASLEV